MSRLKTNAIRHITASADAITLDSSGNATFPANVTCSGTATGFGGGKINQVLQAIKTDVASLSASTDFTDISGLSQQITPSAANSKILVFVTVNTSNASNGDKGFRIMRDSTAIGIGDAASNRPRETFSIGSVSSPTNGIEAYSHTILDSPSTTSATTYKIQWSSNGGVDIYLNRSSADTDNEHHGRTASSITVMEVLA